MLIFMLKLMLMADADTFFDANVFLELLLMLMLMSILMLSIWADAVSDMWTQAATLKLHTSLGRSFFNCSSLRECYILNLSTKQGCLQYSFSQNCFVQCHGLTMSTQVSPWSTPSPVEEEVERSTGKIRDCKANGATSVTINFLIGTSLAILLLVRAS